VDRRQFIKGTLLTSSGLVVIGSTGLWLSIDKSTENLSIDALLARLATIDANSLQSTGKWNPYQIFVHCAQSVDYSIDGYPEHKSAIFKRTAGRLAFSAFSSKRKMHHDLSEPIPGAPALIKTGDVFNALKIFKRSLRNFQNYSGQLAPHFAYGELTKEEYELAHVMHFFNHLKEMPLS
jgi:hypothetical protein